MARHATEVIQIGRELVLAKEKLRHGLFLAWVGSEIGVSFRAAQLHMRAGGWFADKGEMYSRLRASTIYLLTKQTTPPDIVADFVQSVEMDNPASHGELLGRIQAAREQERSPDRMPRSDSAGSGPVSMSKPRGTPQQQTVRSTMKEVVSLLATFLSPSEFRQIRELLLRPEVRWADWCLGAELIAILAETETRRERALVKVGSQSPA